MSSFFLLLLLTPTMFVRDKQRILILSTSFWNMSTADARGCLSADRASEHVNGHQGGHICDGVIVHNASCLQVCCATFHCTTWHVNQSTSCGPFQTAICTFSCLVSVWSIPDRDEGQNRRLFFVVLDVIVFVFYCSCCSCCKCFYCFVVVVHIIIVSCCLCFCCGCFFGILTLYWCRSPIGGFWDCLWKVFLSNGYQWKQEASGGKELNSKFCPPSTVNHLHCTYCHEAVGYFIFTLFCCLKEKK